MAGTSRRGFASMDAEKRRAIASKGGRAAHQKGTAHRFTPEEARAAGRKGGQRAHEKGTAHRFTSEEAREAGLKAAAVRGEQEPAELEPSDERQLREAQDFARARGELVGVS